MILVWMIKAFRSLIKSLLDGLSFVIPDGLEDDIVAFALVGSDGFAALLDLFIADSVLRLLLGAVSLSITIAFFVIVEKVWRRAASLISGSDYKG